MVQENIKSLMTLLYSIIITSADSRLASFLVCSRHTEHVFGFSQMNSGSFMTQLDWTFALNLQFGHVKSDWGKSDPEQLFLLIFYMVAAQ